MSRAEVYRTVLSTNLPGRTETLLLQACLLDGRQGHKAWASLSAETDVSDLLTHGGHGLRRLAPLLYQALGRHSVEADPGLLTRCRMASMREDLRARAFHRVAAGVFDALDDSGIPFIVLKGAALAEPVYGDPVLRHSHDLELLVREEHVRRAEESLRAADCRGREPLRAGGKLRVFHDSGLPVVLRTRLFEPKLYGGDWEWCSERTESVQVAGREVLTLSPALALHHVCVHAVYGHGRSSLQWVVDAIMLIRCAHPASDRRLDWNDVTASVRRSGTGLPISVVFDYLRRDLQAEIPGEVIMFTQRAASEASALERDVALRCVWWGRPHDFVRALRANVGWMDRFRLAFRIAVPSGAYAGYRIEGPAGVRELASYYAGRATRQTARLIRAVHRSLRRPAQASADFR